MMSNIKMPLKIDDKEILIALDLEHPIYGKSGISKRRWKFSAMSFLPEN
jgi:hypothetical protein